MYLYQMNILHYRLNHINKAGKVYLKKTVQQAPSLLSFHTSISKHPFTKVTLNSLALALPTVIIGTLNLTNDRLVNLLLYSLTFAPMLFISVLNLTRWSNWANLKEQVLQENIDWRTIKKNHYLSSRALITSAFVTTICLFLSSITMFYFENGLSIVSAFTIFSLLITQYLGADAHFKTRYLVMMSEDIGKFIGDVGMDYDF